MSQEGALSAEEKKRILRERRQAKMAKGQATDRLNTILGSGSSVQTSATSVLDKPKTTEKSTEKTTQVHVSKHDPDADPEVVDINTVQSETDNTPPDIDEMLKSILAHNSAHSNADNDPLSQMMMNMLGGSGPDSAPGSAPGSSFGPSPEEIQYQTELAAYNQYQKKSYKFIYALVRYAAVLANFWYHFSAQNTFRAASYSYIRGIVPQGPVQTFFTYFLTIEVIILASFYTVSVQKKLLGASSEDGLIAKGLSFGAMVLPQLAKFKPVILQLLSYYELLGMLLSDLSLAIVLFGLLSYAK